MNFEEKGMNEESLIGKVLKIGFFDSLNCNRACFAKLVPRGLQEEVCKGKLLLLLEDFFTPPYPSGKGHQSRF